MTAAPRTRSARPATAPRRVVRGALGPLLAAVLLALAPPAEARSWQVAVDGGSAAGVTRSRFGVGLREVRLGDATLDAWLGGAVRGSLQGAVGAGDGSAVSVGADGVRAALGGGVAARYATTFGPLGTLVLEGGGSLGWLPTDPGDGGPPSAGVVRLGLGARGTIANAALALAVEAGSAAPRELDALRPAPPDARGRAALHAIDDLRRRAGATPGLWDAGGRLGVTYRIDRSTTLELDVDVRRVSAGGAEPATSVGGVLALERIGAVAPYDGWIGVAAERFGPSASAAFGVGVVDAPRRAPARWVRVWFGAAQAPDGATRVAPGLEWSWLSRELPGELRLSGAWRPWLGPDAWRSDVAYRLPNAPLQATFGAYGGADGATWTLGLRWEGDWPQVR